MWHTTLFVTVEAFPFQAGDPKLLLLGDPAALLRITLILYLTESPKRFMGWLLPLLGGDGPGLVLIAWGYCDVLC